MGQTFKGSLDGGGRRVAIAVSRFNRLVTEPLLSGAREELERHGVAEADVDVAWVPGAFELPLAVQRLARGGRYAGVIALGAVVRGATPHFDYVAGQAAAGLGAVARETGVPVAFGVLTTDNLEQAMSRVDKGAEAVRTALEMADIFNQLRATAKASA
jgi:6,7-dimethyl-8-ribityllumazine synthase